ncbi:hypothetical protein [Vulgatibacter sp.]|uniref:hypothetical protein n=1 Tax=Vulgatibacter sp. TaxID=1971226 RepID=UPI003563753B
MKRLLAAVAIAVSFAGCASHTRVPDADRMRLERSLPGRTFYLRHAMYVGPFWSDADKRFLSDGVPGEIPWVVNPAGVPIEPGQPTAVIPAGTRVRIRKLELPTGYDVTTRNPFGPRYNPWLFVDVEGLPRDPAPVILLGRDVQSFDQVMAELERWLSPDDLGPALAQLSPEVRKAVNEKRLVEGMPAEAVAMAWGYPERKNLSPSEEGRREEWIWPFDKRKALIVGGRLISWEGEGATLASE